MTSAEVLVASVPTPFGADGRLDTQAMRELLRDLEPSVDAVLVAGSAGQFPALTDDERLLLFDLALDALGPERVLGHIGAPSLTQVRHLADAAAGIGLRRFVCLTPYFLPVDGAAVLDWYTQVADAVQDGELVVALQPERTGVTVTPATAARLAAVEGVGGLSLGGTAAAEAPAYAAALRPGQRLWSAEDTVLPRVLTEGGHGIVSATSAAFPTLFTRLRAAIRDGAETSSLQDLLREAVATVATLPGLHLALGLQSGHPWRSRMPGPALPVGSREAIAGLLRRVDDVTSGRAG